MIIPYFLYNSNRMQCTITKLGPRSITKVNFLPFFYWYYSQDILQFGKMKICLRAAAAKPKESHFRNPVQAPADSTKSCLVCFVSRKTICLFA